MVRKLASNSSHLTRGLVKYVPSRCYFRAVPSQNGDKYVTFPPPPIVELVSTVLLSDETVLQWLKMINFAEEHHNLRDENSWLNIGTTVEFRRLSYSGGRAIIKHSRRIY